ncbi:MAG TPA: ParB N-terminal domain-containing protein, partial [Gemmatimonadales bacterium]|nr:ParB N-terminal domain-containing protein [Gemmatimonadales bacterium]
GEGFGILGRLAEGHERGSRPPVAENLMSKIVLSTSRDIPLNKLVLSQANVRRIKASVSVDELAEDIARRGLLQSLSVRPVRDGHGQETGTFEVPAGGRRFQALQLLVKQKWLAKTAPVPCLVKTDGVAEEDSLAENTMREALHLLDQFRAFQVLRDEHGLGDEEIAARFFVIPAVVRQRLKLVAVSPKLLDLYAANAMSLEQLMSFTVMNDHARQEQVWEGLARGYNKEPYLAWCTDRLAGAEELSGVGERPCPAPGCRSCRSSSTRTAATIFRASGARLRTGRPTTPTYVSAAA